MHPFCDKGGRLSLSCISHHPTVEAREEKAVIRVSCLVIRENHGRGLGSLQKKCLTASEPEGPHFVTRGVKEVIWQVRLARAFFLRPARASS